ncbi:MAG: hypothetical protein S4CHLAM37_15170 [Chlamydiia bacterium]|nr:hypothetical protein [Chlamydiia bacterium]
MSAHIPSCVVDVKNRFFYLARVEEESSKALQPESKSIQHMASSHYPLQLAEMSSYVHGGASINVLHSLVGYIQRYANRSYRVLSKMTGESMEELKMKPIIVLDSFDNLEVGVKELVESGENDAAVCLMVSWMNLQMTSIADFMLSLSGVYCTLLERERLEISTLEADRSSLSQDQLTDLITRKRSFEFRVKVLKVRYTMFTTQNVNFLKTVPACVASINGRVTKLSTPIVDPSIR